MSKIFLLGANKEINRAVQVVEVNQVIQMEGYSYHRYVVYDISKNQWGGKSSERCPLVPNLN